MKKEEGRNDLCGRTTAFALRVIGLFAALPKTAAAQVLGNNRSKVEFIV